MVRVLLPLACLATACSLAGGAWALGLGAVQTPPVLGQSLDLTLPIRLGDGETLDARCIDAQVHVGDSRLPADQLVLALRPGARPGEVLVRLRSGVALTEPVVTLSVTAGCPARVTRRYTLLAELPALAPAPTAAATPPVAAAGGGLPDVAQRDATASAATSARTGAAPRRAHEATHAAAAPPRARVAPMLTGSSAPPASVDARPRAVATPAETAVVTAGDAAPHAATTDAPLASPPAQADRTVPAAPRVQAGVGDDRGGGWGLLVAALAAGGAAAGALAWRRRRATTAAGGQAPPAGPVQEAMAPSLASAAPWAPAPPDPVASRSASAAPIVTRRLASSPVDDLVAPDDVPAPLDADTGRVEATDALPLLDLSLDEQIDLEQQVDFFVVLGRDDAAVDLLHEHLRRCGGRMPLAWLKLLEIHRRGGDRERYEATARRFGEAFGVVAPGWDAVGPRRGLDDDAPRLTALQRCWSRPSDAMAWLDALLHRRDDPSGHIDLGTYDDALLLYRIARDLHDHGAEEPGGVDLLLPADDETHLGPGRPAPSPPRDGAPVIRDLGAALPFELDFDRVAEEAGREALVVR